MTSGEGKRSVLDGHRLTKRGPDFSNEGDYEETVTLITEREYFQSVKVINYPHSSRRGCSEKLSLNWKFNVSYDETPRRKPLILMYEEMKGFYDCLRTFNRNVPLC